MPELPEVETVRMGLEPVLTGQTFARVTTHRADLRFPFPENFAKRLTGARVMRLERRAKYLIAHLSTGEALLMHLGMTGRFHVQAKGEAVAHLLGDYEYETGAQPKHMHAVFDMRGGARVTYADPRRFGYMLLVPDAELAEHALMRGLGVEPLSDDLTPAYLARRAVGRRSDLKAFLMDQRIVAGLGNIYVCEALFLAQLRPSRPASVLATRGGKPTVHATRLAAGIKAVLKAAIAAGGSTLRDYRQADGSTGAFQNTFQVYGREGEPCVRPGCRGIVRRSTQAGRSSFYCPVCQH
ncbi:bifunctional DNA-formamidopyrimidine glycosylase/DNA-(apurinic or apyrimidinic site) lyase [Hyphomicrobium sp.]|uniref:bifunctional DNA-formamidopyrimidine glycosylase/DNA-(apurinic or apyrimidinic site) lyase n=1 Tax=Hyphomicrobium sp. TaxID=82 RepID=UPI0025C6E4D9|nr:bifunctional DNA-formamidopyrimidine glycosylase/DNA-(apurinic or apyrimidinic site) lyase [Hyphomicrobium sp.]MCC7252792.1 bifunctional DNA-formamidopyrimidine glycosylase/DNA-(apurinic or apyrimidinic site) lyase [Hyphomicrobium sp.]